MYGTGVTFLTQKTKDSREILCQLRKRVRWLAWRYQSARAPPFDPAPRWKVGKPGGAGQPEWVSRPAFSACGSSRGVVRALFSCAKRALGRLLEDPVLVDGVVLVGLLVGEKLGVLDQVRVQDAVRGVARRLRDRAQRHRLLRREEVERALEAAAHARVDDAHLVRVRVRTRARARVSALALAQNGQLVLVKRTTGAPRMSSLIRALSGPG